MNPAPPPASAGAPGGGASQTTGTNNQVAGVDEADFLKNDDKYLYVAREGKLRIVDAFPAAGMREVGSADVPGVAKKLFVSGNRAVVFSSVTRTNATSPGPGAGAGAPGGGSGARECTYGYDCDFTGDGTATTLSFFDITNRAAPRLVRTLVTDGSYLAARRIGTTVHTVLVRQMQASGGYPTSPNLPPNATEAEVDAAFDALLAANEAAIAQSGIDVLGPKVVDDQGTPAKQAFYRAELPDGEAFTTLLSFDLAGAALKSTTILSRPGAVYASADSLTMAVPHQRGGYGWYDGQANVPELSTLHKFSLGIGPLDSRYVASGLVKGKVLNQFSMDEHQGHLRIATTTGRTPDPNVHSTISVLGQVGPRLVLEGQIDNIAKTEDIRSVRFDEDRGYIVTFKKTDPLFVFDLSVPTAPRTLGELKIPGFSTYMHMMDKNHLLTIGYDAADQGDFAFFSGVLLQIFDVSNPASPRLAHKEVIGTRGSSSEALTNHLGFTYYAQRNLLALPMTVCEGGSGPGFGSTMTFSGLMVYDVSTTAGFALRGRVAHPTSPGGGGYDSAGCYNWWSHASSDVKRSVFMDDFVYSVSDSRIKANDVKALSTDIKEVSLR